MLLTAYVSRNFRTGRRANLPSGWITSELYNSTWELAGIGEVELLRYPSEVDNIKISAELGEAIKKVVDLGYRWDEESYQFLY